MIIIAGVLVVTGILFFLISSMAMDSLVKKEFQDLLKMDVKVDQKIISEKDLNGLPPIVKNYIRGTGIIGKEIPKDVFLRQRGLFRTEVKGKWMPLSATQLFNLKTRAFIWHGKISIIPGITIQARDYYKEQKGNMHIKFAGSITMANVKGPEIDQSAFIRFATEMVWYPWLFLDRNLVKWQAVDNKTAIAHVVDGPNKGAITCTFNDKNELVQVAAKRYMKTKDGSRLLPWGGVCSHYRLFQGIKIPSRAKIYWDLPEGRFECIDLQVTDAVYGMEVKKYID